MVKKRMADGSECRKCVEATEHLQSRGLWDRIDDIVWAHENDPMSPGMKMGEDLGVERAPFFLVREGTGESIYTSVLQLVRERLGQTVSVREQVLAIDPDDIGGI
ncbi:MAG: hypothetical protein ABI051_14305 [Vicinamibacterales bacterium]